MVNPAQSGDEHIGIDAKSHRRSGTKTIHRRVVTQQQVDTGCDASGHGIQTIAALLDQHQSTIAQGASQLDNDVRQLCEACRGDVHITKWIIPVCIKACRNQDHLRVKAISSWSHYLTENGFIGLIASRGWQWHIDGGSQSFTVTPLIRMPGTWIKRCLVDRKVEHSRIIIEDILDAIAVV